MSIEHTSSKNRFASPVFLLIITLISIFISEILVMLFIAKLPAMSHYYEAVLDGIILTVILYPSLFFFVFKPIKTNLELRIKAESELNKTIEELKKSLDEIKVLHGILPFCAACKKIRNDKGYWDKIENYLLEHSEIQFNHGMCPECRKKYYKEF